jgi:archaemetzincin
MPPTLTRRTLLELGALSVASALAPRALADPAPILVIQPLGKALADVDASFVRRSLRAFYAFDVQVAPRVPLPRSAFYPPRHRWRAEKLLAFLVAHAPADASRVLGLTAEDISTTKGKVKDWGILGLATIGGRSGVASSFRCARGAHGAEARRIRLGKVSVHELGHTLGLEHCPNRGCLMEDAEGTAATLDREYDLCADCRLKIVHAGHELNRSGTPPWPKP